jgi:hypothetical protein
MKLSDTQLVILTKAAGRDDGSVYPLPRGLKDGAATRVLNTLIKTKLIEEVEAKRGETMFRETGDGHGVTLVITKRGLEAIDGDGGDAKVTEPKTKAKPAPTPKKQKDAAKTKAAARAERKATAKPKAAAAAERAPRDSKQAKMIEMLKRPNGASVDEIAAEFGWLKHTTRAAVSVAVRKLGLTSTATKEENRGTVYRIAA